MAKPNYEYSGVCYVATAGQTTFALTTTGGNAIGYLKPEHIKVRTSDDAGVTWNSLALDTGFVFADPATSVTLSTGASVGDWIDIHRETPATKDYIEFQDGDLLTAGQLNDFDDWQLYIDQEILDRVESLTAPDINLADTDDLPEGSVNLYYTDARVEAWVDSNLDSTDKLAEGSTNLYYTDARVQAVIDGGGYITDAGVTKLKAGPNITLDPASGVGEVTISSTGGGGESSSYWELDGANLHPKGDSTDVHIGDDKIILDHSGAATFAGGAFFIDETGAIATNIRSAGHIKLDSTGVFTDPPIFLNSTTGSATFAAGKASIDADGVLFGEQCTIAGVSAYFEVDRDKAPNNGTILFQGKAQGIQKFRVATDGSATFKGQITATTGYALAQLPALPA